MESKAFKGPQSINSTFLLPTMRHFFVKNYSLQKKFAMARTLPPARETRALPNHPRATHRNPRFHKTPIANHLSRIVSLAERPGAAAEWVAPSVLRWAGAGGWAWVFPRGGRWG